MRKNNYIKSYSDNFFLLSYSDLFRVSMDPRVKPEGDGRGMMPEGDGKKCAPEGDGRGMVPKGSEKKCELEGVGKKCAPEGNFSLLSSLRAVARGQAIFELISNFPLSKEGKNKIGMTMMMWILVSSTSMTNTVHAECVPTPDCASIGYTATSCDGDSLKCPFDTSKLFCMPCDTKYKYSCSNTGQVGSGDSCNGKYIECKCVEGYTLSGDICVSSCSDSSCKVGNIFYSDGTCCADKLGNKTAIGVVVKENKLVMSIKRTYMSWASDANVNLNIGDLNDMLSDTIAKEDYNGQSNTAMITFKHTNMGENVTTSAAMYCIEFATEGTNRGDWYLPAAGEVENYVYGNHNILSPVYTNSFGWNGFYAFFWTSSESDDSNAWVVGSGDFSTNVKNHTQHTVSCFLDIGVGNSNTPASIHKHSYECSSSTNWGSACVYGVKELAPKTCSCGAKGTCYTCNSTSL